MRNPSPLACRVAFCVAWLALVGAAFATWGCETSGLTDTPRYTEDREYPLEFSRGKFAEYAKVDEKPARRLINIQLIRVLWDNGVKEQHEVDRRGDYLPVKDRAQDLGFIRHEKIAVLLGLWDERDESGFNVRHPDAVKFPVTDDNGDQVIYQAVYQDRFTYTDMVGNELAHMDGEGMIFAYDPDLGMRNLGVGTPQDAARLIFGLEERSRMAAVVERDDYEEIVEVPDRSDAMRDINRDLTEEYEYRMVTDEFTVLIDDVDMLTAEARYKRAVQNLREHYDQYDPDPIYGDPDRRYNRYGTAPDITPDVEDDD